VAQIVLERGAVRLQDAVNIYEASGGRAYAHSTRFLEHLLRHLPLSAFSGARKLGWMLFERTDPFSVLARLLQHIRVLEDRQRTFNAMSKETYHELEQLMKAEERVFSRYLLVQLYGAVETKARFGITNSDVVVSKIDNTRVRFDSAEGGCADTVRKNSRVTIKSPRKGGRVSWYEKPHVAKVFLAEVERTVVFLYKFIKEKVYTK